MVAFVCFSPENRVHSSGFAGSWVGGSSDVCLMSECSGSLVIRSRARKIRQQSPLPLHQPRLLVAFIALRSPVSGEHTRSILTY